MLSMAKELLNPRKTNHYLKLSDTVCVMETINGNIYRGISLVARCGLGYCSEQSCIVQMINNGETKIKQFLTIDKNGNPISPCGRCIELITQIDSENHGAIFFIGDNVTKSIKDVQLLDWKGNNY